MKFLIFLVFTTNTALAYALGPERQIECRQSMVKNTSVNGPTRVSLRDYTLNELCTDNSLNSCRHELKEKLINDPQIQIEITQKLEMDGNSQLAKDILAQSINEIVDTLLSTKLIWMTIHVEEKVKIGETNFVEYRPINKLRTSVDRKVQTYEVYPNLEFNFGLKKGLKFRSSLGGKITKDLSEILSFEQYGNYSVAYFDDWYLKKIRGPEIYNAIVGDQLVITLQKKLGKIESVMTYPIPLGEKLEINFITYKGINRLAVKVDASFSIECRYK